MANVTKCAGCGSFFNSSIYSSCPYCGKALNTDTSSKEKEIKTSGVRGFISKISRKQTEEKAKDQNVELSEHEEKQSDGNHENSQDKIPDTLSEEVSAEDIDVSKINEEKQISSKHIEEDTNGDNRERVDVGSLKSQLSKAGRTIGKYVSTSGETLSPVVGWIIGVKGEYFGQSFPLKSGRNKIGRSSEMDVKLLGDESVSRTCVAVLIYDTKANDFCILPGESDSLTYVNNAALYERTVLSGLEEIEFGDSGRNKYLFVPLCGKSFQWANYSKD